MISPLSLVDPRAKLGANVTVDAFAVIHGDVEIGDNTYIHAHAVIFDGARIGHHCQIFPFASISAAPQDLKYAGEPTTTIIGNYTIIRECATVNRGTTWLGFTQVGERCLLMAYSHVAHDCILGDNVILANSVNLAGHIVIEENATVGGASAVHQFVRIGAYAFISGGSLVRKDVPPFVKAAREPLSFVGVNSVGLQRKGFTSEQMFNIKEAYRLLFVKHRSVSKALEAINVELAPSTERNRILDFITHPARPEYNRGLMKGYTPGDDD